MLTRRSVTATALTLTMSLTALVAPAANAQDASPGASISPFCAVLTAEEASSALGVTVIVQPDSSSDVNCNYFSDFTQSTELLGLDVRFEQSAIGDGARIAFPTGVDLQVAGLPGYYLADLTLLFVDLPTGGSLAVQLVGTPAEGVDPQTALVSLAEIALTRLPTIPLPSPQGQPSIEPVPSLVGDPELDAMFPADIGGSPVITQSLSGQEIASFVDPSDPEAQQLYDQFLELLGSQGRTIEDVSAAFGATVDGSASITAIRVRGADINPLVEQLIALVTSTTVGAAQVTPSQVGGRNVSVVTVDDETQYAYPSNDVLWLVEAEEPALTEVFQKLP
jgi:hypothetical protein